MLAKLEHWLWGGSFEPDFKKLEIPMDREAGEWALEESVDLAVERTLQDVWRQLEMAEETLRRSDRTGGRHGESKEDEARQLVLQMLPALDALDRIVDCGEQLDEPNECYQNLLESVRAFRVRLNRIMEKVGLSAISSVGTEVDLDMHDVVAVVPAGEFPPNTVVDERAKGYFLNGKLLRDAKVVVAQ